MSQEAVSELLSPILQDLDLELDELAIKQAGKQRVVKVTVDGDGPKGTGPDLDSIAAATRKISDALDESDLLGDAPYTLEVSSRGVSSPLVRPAHYRRNIGRLVLVHFVDSEQPLRARITDADDEKVTLTPEPEPKGKPGAKRPKPGDPVEYPYSQIGKAVVQVEINRK